MPVFGFPHGPILAAFFCRPLFIDHHPAATTRTIVIDNFGKSFSLSTVDFNYIVHCNDTFDTAPDMVINGVGYQLKFERAQIIAMSTLVRRGVAGA